MSEFKQLNEHELKDFINQLVEEYYDDYIETEERKSIFVNQVFDTAFNTCESLYEVTTLVDGILIGWFMSR
jgi:phosphatidylinositol kinase/protein kinase (PI-3  family)